jgi:hypothetical protein
MKISNRTAQRARVLRMPATFMLSAGFVAYIGAASAADTLDTACRTTE